MFAVFPFLLVLYEITNYLANDMYLPALPYIASDLNTTVHMAQQTLTSWFLGTAAFQLFLGPLSDRLGRRPILFGGGLVFVLATLTCALTTNIHVLIIARFFQGSAVCSVVTAGYSSIHELYDSKRAIQILAIMNSVTVLAPAFGPLLGAAILQGFRWPVIFYVLAIWAIMGLIFLWFVMPESNPKKNRDTFDFSRLCKNYVSIITNKEFLLNSVIFCLTFLGMITWIAAGPFLVINQFHYNSIMFGLMQVMVFGSLIVGSQVVKHYIHRTDPRTLINVGLSIALVSSIFALVVTAVLPHFLMGLILALTLFSFGSSLAFSTSQRIAIEACDAPMGTRIAVLSTFMSIFGVVAVILVSLTYTGELVWFGIVLFILSVLACLLRWIDRELRHAMI